MPKIKETENAFVVSQGFGEQLQAVLPTLLAGIRQASQQIVEQKQRRVDILTQFHQLNPELQQILANDPDFVQAATGKKMREPQGPPGGIGPKYSDLPIRDLTEEEVLARKTREQQLKSAELQDQRTKQIMEQAQLEIDSSQRKIQAYKKIDNVPPDQLSLMDFVVGYPELSFDERSALFLEKKYGPEMASKIAQVKVGEGPEIEKARVTEAFGQCTTTFGQANANCFKWAEAVGRRDLTALEKIPDAKMRTLAFQNFQQQQKQDANMMARADLAHKEAIGVAAQKILSDDPRIPLDAARQIATALYDGKEIPASLRKYDVDRVAMQQVMADTTVSKMRFELEENQSGVTALKNMVDMNLKVLADKSGAPKDVRKMSEKQLGIILPELNKRVAKLLGVPEPKPGEPSWIGKFVQSVIGLGSAMSQGVGGGGPELTGGVHDQANALQEQVNANPTMNLISSSMQQGMKDIVESPPAQAVTESLRQLGITISPLLEGPLYALDAIRKSALSGAAPQAVYTAPKAGKKVAVAPSLDPDQKVALQNMALEINKIVANPSTPLPVLQKFSDLLDLIDDVQKGKRSYSEVINAAGPHR